MSDKIITVGIWIGAPFGSSIISGIEKLNTFLKSENLDVRYEPVRLDENNLPKDSKTPEILILDGGEDINPTHYGQKNKYSSFSDARDTAEMKLLQYMVHRDRRLSGICRGHQLINVYFGGSLYQDITRSGVVTERNLAAHKGGHKVRLKRPLYRSSYKFSSKYGDPPPRKKQGHLISRFVGHNPFIVSSMHHQAVNTLGNHMGVSLTFGVSKSSRYIIEGIESSHGKFRGIQSHPEFGGHPKDGLMFSYLMHIDSYVDNLFEPDMEEIKARLEAGKDNKPHDIPFDVKNSPPPLGLRTGRDRLRDDLERREDNLERQTRGANVANVAGQFVPTTATTGNFVFPEGDDDTDG